MQLYEGECPSSGWRRPGKEPQGCSYACYIVQGVARLPCPRLRSRTLTSPPAVHTPRSRPPHYTFSNSSTLPPPRPPRSPPFRSGLLRHAQAGPRASVQDRPHRPQVRDGAAPQQGDRPGAAHRAAVPVAARHGHAGSGRRRRRRWRRLVWAGDIRPGGIQGCIRARHGGVAGHGGPHAQRAAGQGLPRAVQVSVVVSASSLAFHAPLRQWRGPAFSQGQAVHRSVLTWQRLLPVLLRFCVCVCVFRTGPPGHPRRCAQPCTRPHCTPW